MFVQYQFGQTTEIKLKFQQQKSMIKTKVAVVGGGPVGIFASLLLQHFNIEHVTFEKFDKPRSHPSAHWVSGRSKQLLSQIPNLAQNIDQAQQSFESFRYYRYCESLFGFQFGFKDHFKPSIKQKIQQTKSIFGQYPNHISQAKLLEIMYNNVKTKQRMNFNSNISSIEQINGSNILYNYKKQKVCEAQYVILANGFKSDLRDSLKIKMLGDDEFMNIINIHFQSKALADKIKQKKVPAMLHFVYNKKLPSILVNHSYETGTFVLQVPNYQPFIDLMKVYTPRQLISSTLEVSDWKEIQKDVKIIHIGKWKLQALLANKFRKNNIFLVGDTAHTFTPAGGFGMNSGFQDANQIVHFIDMIQRNKQCNKQNILQLYNKQRRQIDQKYMKKSLQNYRLTQQISSKVIKYSTTLTQTFTKLSRNIPKSFGNLFYNDKDSFIQSIRLNIMSTLYKRAKFQPELQLFFDDFDKSVGNLSSLSNKIIENTKNGNVKDFYVNKAVKLEEISSVFGNIKQQNIEFFDDPNIKQRIIRRDGIFMQ